MGLDITAYSQLRKAAPGEGYHPDYPGEADYENNYHQFYINPDFPGRADEFEGRVIYACDGDTHEFRAGSYGGYNAWREELAALAGYTPRQAWDNPKKYKGKPFYELVNFSDCEGTLGTAVCKKLAKDFDDFDANAQSLESDNRYFYDRYQEWRKVFHLASDNGAVTFH